MDKLTEIRKALNGYLRRSSYSEIAQFKDNAPDYITYLLQLVETQAKALEWYADEDNYDPVHLDKFGIIPIDDDQGQRAREALTQV